MTELELLVDLHRDTPRQGPGSTAETRKALSFVPLAPGAKLKVADIGCGSGAQTITLAQQLDGQITAIDLFPEFLAELNTTAQKMGLTDKINTLAASMEELPFEKQELDLIWSEGAIYNMGFENGVKSWSPYLKAGGYLAVSEITWLTNARPAEIETYWNTNYPEIATAARKIRILEDQGFSLLGYQVLAPASWITNYYAPLEARCEAFLAKHGHADIARQIVEEQLQEIALYHKFKDYYSYGFYVARKVG
jgi:cyclopropane fatty-acyl-phospholipid synthase-like methyltransferase